MLFQQEEVTTELDRRQSDMRRQRRQWLGDCIGSLKIPVDIKWSLWGRNRSSNCLALARLSICHPYLFTWCLPSNTPTTIAYHRVIVN